MDDGRRSQGSNLDFGQLRVRGSSFESVTIGGSAEPIGSYPNELPDTVPWLWSAKHPIPKNAVEIWGGGEYAVTVPVNASIHEAARA